jgi:tRNA splicing endonuclease
MAALAESKKWKYNDIEHLTKRDVETTVLTPCETIYLLDERMLDVYHMFGVYTRQQLFRFFKDGNLERDYCCFRYFKLKGFVVRCGAKYGAHFLLYRDIPGVSHAEYFCNLIRFVVRIYSSYPIPVKSILGSLRVLNKVKKVLSRVT